MNYSRFGEFIRILRIKNHEVMGDTAKLLGVSAPFLSNVENGKKKVPDGWFEKLVEHYKLKGEEAKKLEEAIEESKTKVKIELAECDDYRKRTALAFQRSFYDLSENQTKRILEILEEGDK